ncbi:START domain-containing protein [Thalassotalea montiporae]
MANRRFSKLFHHFVKITFPLLLSIVANPLILGKSYANAGVEKVENKSTATHWQLVRTSDAIKVYTAKPAKFQKQNENKHLAHIRAELTVRSSLSGFLLFLQDYDNIPNWLDNAYHSELISQESPTRNIFITYFEGIWPVKPRDMVIDTEFTQQPDLSINIDVKDASNEIPLSNDIVRVSVLHANWLIKPIERLGYIHIAYEFSVDPNGAIPVWLVNQMTVNSVWQTMRNIEQQLPASQWQQFHINSIKEQAVQISPTP